MVGRGLLNAPYAPVKGHRIAFLKESYGGRAAMRRVDDAAPYRFCKKVSCLLERKL